MPLRLKVPVVARVSPRHGARTVPAETHHTVTQTTHGRRLNDSLVLQDAQFSAELRLRKNPLTWECLETRCTETSAPEFWESSQFRRTEEDRGRQRDLIRLDSQRCCSCSHFLTSLICYIKQVVQNLFRCNQTFFHLISSTAHLNISYYYNMSAKSLDDLLNVIQTNELHDRRPSLVQLRAFP